VRQVDRLEAALEMAQVVLDALPEEEKSRLERERGKLLKQADLFVDLLLKESTSKVCWPDGSPEKSDTGTTDGLNVVDSRLGAVEGERVVAGGKEVVDMVNSGRVVGEDDNVVEVGEDDGRGRVGDREARWSLRAERVSRMAGEKRKGARGSPWRTPDVDCSPSAPRKATDEDEP
jgi:hypothetical protein